MKKIMFTVMVFLLAIGVAYAGQDVRNSKHNLSSTGTLSLYKTTSTDRVCVFCHTPHFAASGEAPLWNRTLPSNSGYTLYSSATIDMTIAAPQGVSLACLSCHDGTVAFDALVNKPGSGIGAPSGWSWNTNGNTMTLSTSPSAMLGQDLRDDHPISITYDTNADTAFNAADANGKVGTLPLYGSAKNQVECGSCHDPHQSGVTGNPTFLRMSNSGSALCLTCHIK